MNRARFEWDEWSLPETWINWPSHESRCIVRYILCLLALNLTVLGTWTKLTLLMIISWNCNNSYLSINPPPRSWAIQQKSSKIFIVSFLFALHVSSSSKNSFLLSGNGDLIKKNFKTSLYIDLHHLRQCPRLPFLNLRFKQTILRI